jgi:hypothetical protein
MTDYRAEYERRRAEHEHFQRWHALGSAHQTDTMQGIVQARYARSRYPAVGRVLWWARNGELERDWRTSQLPQYLEKCGMGDSDEGILVLHDLAEIPVQPWEPYAATGDWRAALDAWYRHAVENEQYSITHRPQRPARSPELIAWSPDPAAAAEEERRDTVTAEQRAAADAQLSQQSIDMLGASYFAGRTAGGDHFDWRGWLHRRSKTWTGREPLNMTPTSYAWYERLPNYWTQKAAPA